ncbi:MAG: transcription elongation factor GreA [Syntrophomonadaceae bacterium]|nr:transcription elongation factor GreA [Syntrophomonadaceae bacterium]
MPEKEVILTKNGLERLEAELDHLKTVKRREIAERIKQSIGFGDITENSEYEDAKNEQAFIEGRILTLEKILRNARVVDGSDAPDNVVSVGSRVVLKDLDEGQEVEFTVVGSAEADPNSRRISIESPVGKAILGLTVGKIVEVMVPAGRLHFQILDVNR